MTQVKLGFGRQSITPDYPVRMNSQCTNNEVWHEIFAHVLYLCDDTEKVLVINLDERELYAHFLDPLRPMVAEKTGVPEDKIIFCTTHNHSCPDVGASDGNAVLEKWKKELAYPGILRAAEEAVLDAKPVVRMTGGKAISPRLNFVRRYQLEDGTWKGIATANTSTSPRVAHESEADLEFRAVRLYREGGKDIVLMNYQTHAAGALSVFQDKLNADFCGELRDDVEAATGTYAVYLQGACGNTNYFTYLKEEKEKDEIRDYREVGHTLAKTALEALENSSELPLGKLRVRAEKYMAWVDHRLDHLKERALEIADMDDAAQRQEAMRQAGINNRYELWGIVRRANLPAQNPTDLSSIAIGDFAMAFCPHEMFDQLGRQLRDISPYPMTFPCNYAQVYCGYMPSQNMVPHGEYEVNMCYYIPGTGETEILRLGAQLQDMRNS